MAKKSPPQKTSKNTTTVDDVHLMLEIPQDYNVTTTKTSPIIQRTTAPTYYSGKDKERYGTLLQNNFQNIQPS